MRFFLRVAAGAFAAVVIAASAGTFVRADGSMADVDAAARSQGNRPALARGIGDALFATSWPAQITKVRVDAVGTHAVAGLTLSGVKFHSPMDRAAFVDEVSRLISLSFEHSTVEEVDLWTTVPLPTRADEVVSGDKAMPTSHVVFAISARRSEAGDVNERLQSGRDVFWDTAWERTLDGR